MIVDFFCGHKGQPVICEECRDAAAQWAFRQGVQTERERCAKIAETKNCLFGIVGSDVPFVECTCGTKAAKLIREG